MRRVLERSRWLMAPVSIAILLLSVVVMAWGIVKGIDFTINLVTEDGWKRDEFLPALLEAIDVLLIGTVLVIFGLGLWELFVTPLELPEWLVIGSLDDLKAKLGNALVLVLAIKFLEILTTNKDALDVLWYAIAVTVVGGLLVAYTQLSRKSH